MKLYSNSSHPLRVYLEDENYGEIARLMTSLECKYYPHDNQTNSYNQEDEVDSIIFYDDELGRHYVVHGLINIILRELMLLNIMYDYKEPFEQGDNISEKLEVDPNILEGITLREYQIEGISSALYYKRGIIQVHTGGGKTEMMTSVAKYLLDNSDTNILICVPTTNLLYQTFDRVKSRGIVDSNISLLGDGNKLDTSKRLIISTVASAYKRLESSSEYMEWLKSCDCLMLDEAHHSKCRTWSTLIDRVAPKYLLGFSAEPFHRDKSHMVSDLVLRGLLGPVIHRVTMDYLVEHGYLAKPYVLALESKYKGSIYKVVDWRVVNKSCIVQNEMRNGLIRDTTSMLIEEDKRPLILVQQIAHGVSIAKSISSLGYSVYMMQGGRKISVYANGTNIDNYVDNDNIVLRDFNEGKIDALIGTSTLDEGADIPSLSSVILAGGGKGRLKTIQKVGRSLRPKSGENVAYIIDFRDRFNVITQSQFQKRKSLYDEMGMGVYYLNDIEDIRKLIRENSRLANQPTTHD